MEALGGNNRQSGILSSISRERIDRNNTERTYTSVSTMAATAVVSPTASMYSNPPSYSSGWSAPTAHSVSGLISPPESRRTSDNKTEQPPSIQTNPPHRQSLPSIHEALNSGPKTNPYASPVSASLPPSHHQLPYSQSQPPSIPRSYPPSEHPQYQSHIAPSQPRHASPPQPVHPYPNPFSRPDTIPATFPESRHSSLTSAPAPHNPYAGPRYEPSTYEQDPRAPERMSNGYTHHPPQQGAYTYGPGPSPIAPSGHHGPAFNHPRYQPRPGESDGWKKDDEKMGTPPFKQGLKRHLDVWDFENNLAQINVSSSALQEWSRHYNAIAQEQQRSVNVIPDRMPTLDSCEDMMVHQGKILFALQRMKEIIQQQEHALMDQQMREQGGRGPGEYDDEMSIYGDEMKNQGFGATDGKKRRGRAAPPGRCHSCNRAETPEWRRGPDGARTLCNACGLHYAKLTRKNTMKQSQGSNGSSLRPKSLEDASPRPL